MNLSGRKIAIFADTEFASIKQDILDTKLFKEKNIIQIFKSDIRKSDNYNLFLVNWSEYSNKIDEIISTKKSETGLLIYSPSIRLTEQDMTKINNTKNSMLVNFRGRLLNDLLVSIITTGTNSK